MNIKLGDKTYTQNTFKGLILRRYLEVDKRLRDNVNNQDAALPDLDAMCDFLVEAFENQFTADEILKELEYYEIILNYRSVGMEIDRRTLEKMGLLEKN